MGKSQPTQSERGCNRCKTAENPSKNPLQPVFPAAVTAGWLQPQPTRLSPALLSPPELNASVVSRPEREYPSQSHHIGVQILRVFFFAPTGKVATRGNTGADRRSHFYDRTGILIRRFITVNIDPLAVQSIFNGDAPLSKDTLHSIELVGITEQCDIDISHCRAPP